MIAAAAPVSPAAAERATPVFGPPQTVATASDVGFLTELETGDVNGDGLTDAVVTRLEFQTHETFPIGVFLADGRGGFQNGDSLFAGPIPRTEHARQIVIADFNGDRRNDIFVADHGYDAPPFPGYPNTLALSTPEGKLVDASANLPAESGFSHSAAAADIDRDGDVDIFVGNIFGGDAPPELLLNDGAGHFVRGDGRLPAAQTDRSQNKYTRSLFVDVNGDAAPDLVLGADNNTPSSTVLLNDGTGHFTAVPDAMPPKEFGPTGITIALATLDANQDGRPDLIVGFTRQDPFYTGRRLQVLIGNGDGTFRDETASRLPVQDEGDEWPNAIRVADLNGDGRADFAVPHSGLAAKPALYLDDATGVFRLHLAGEPMTLFTLLDANRDGRPDLLGSFAGNTERHVVQLQLTDDDGVHSDRDDCPTVADPGGNGCPGATLTSAGAVRTAKAGKGGVRLITGIKAFCPDTGEDCQARGTVTTAGKQGRRALKALRLGTAKLTVGSGKKSQVSFELSASGAEALREAGRLKAKITLAITGPDDKQVKLSRTATIKAP